MTIRKHRSQAEWQAIIQQQKNSGLSAIKFCQQQGLSSKTFYKHRRTQHSVRGNDTSLSPFIKIKKPATSIISRRSEPMSVLHYHHCQLHVQPGTDARWLAELLQALS